LRSLPQGTVLLYPLILENRLELIVFAAGSPPIRRTVAVKSKDLEEAIFQFRDDLQDVSSNKVRASSQKLYKWLVQPIENDLKNAKTILYAPDGQLRYIPLAALYDGKQWLVEKYQINYLISYSLANLNSTIAKSPNILAGAFGKADKFKFSGLPSTEPEVKNIAKNAPNTKVLIEKQFSRSATESQLPSHNYIHLATHAEFGDSPQDSFIIFGNGDRITVEEIKNWKLPHVELVVLSACKTGLGGKLGTGIEVLGFGYQLQRTGVKNSIATLWAVSDDGTGAFMESFYKRLLQDKRSPSQSLQQAQIALATGKVSHPNSKIKLSHPFYWSPFFSITSGF